MHWQDILAIVVPLMALMGWMYSRIDKKFELVFKELKSIREDLYKLDMRLSRLEAKFEERGYWESRLMNKTGTDLNLK